MTVNTSTRGPRTKWTWDPRGAAGRWGSRERWAGELTITSWGHNPWGCRGRLCLSQVRRHRACPVPLASAPRSPSSWGLGSRLRPQLQPLFSLSWTPTPLWMPPRPPPRWMAPGPGHSRCTTTPLPRLSPLNKPIEAPHTGQGCDLPPRGLPGMPLREAFWLGR